MQTLFIVMVVDVVVLMAPQVVMIVVPNDPYGGGSDSSFSSEFRIWCRHDWCTQQHEQFKQSMIAINNSLINVLQCQQRRQNDTTCALQVIHQLQWYQGNGSLIDDIPTFDGKPKLYFDMWFLKYRCCDQMEYQRVSFRKSSRHRYKMPESVNSWCELE